MFYNFFYFGGKTTTTAFCNFSLAACFSLSHSYVTCFFLFLMTLFTLYILYHFFALSDVSCSLMNFTYHPLLSFSCFFFFYNTLSKKIFKQNLLVCLQTRSSFFFKCTIYQNSLYWLLSFTCMWVYIGAQVHLSFWFFVAFIHSLYISLVIYLPVSHYNFLRVHTCLSVAWNDARR